MAAEPGTDEAIKARRGLKANRCGIEATLLQRLAGQALTVPARADLTAWHTGARARREQLGWAGIRGE